MGNLRSVWAVVAGAAAALGGASCAGPGESRPEPGAPAADASRMTADIQAGIEAHIAAQARRDGGRLLLPFEGRHLRLELVRVHTEYLASLGPGRYFACVDLADAGGDVFDVDFFLDGQPGAMVVTETIVHKRNGQPFYAWQQGADRTWSRIPAAAASPRELGVVTGRDAFAFRYRVVLPALDGPARLWCPLPRSDEFQTVVLEAIDAPETPQTLTEPAHGNRVLYLALPPQDAGGIVEIRFRVERRETGAYAATLPDREQYLRPERRVPAEPRFAQIARDVVAGKATDLMRARAIYDHVMAHLRYQRFGVGWGQGDAGRACDAGSGNCTDYHAYFIALARAVGIPARFAIGAAVPSERDAGGVDGYHCWAEFHADGRWWPVDISEADKYSRLATYYFGHHPANRVEFSRGRDLLVEPGPASGPINFLAYPVLEVAGKPVAAKVEFSFRRLPLADAPAAAPAAEHAGR